MNEKRCERFVTPEKRRKYRKVCFKNQTFFVIKKFYLIFQREYTLISSTSEESLTNNQSEVSLSKRWKNESQIFLN